MIAVGGGRIVNLGGLTGHVGDNERAHVLTAKAGLVGFTRALAHDLAADRILVAIGPCDSRRGRSRGSRRGGASR